MAGIMRSRELLLVSRLVKQRFHSVGFGCGGLRFQSNAATVGCVSSSNRAGKSPLDALGKDFHRHTAEPEASVVDILKVVAKDQEVAESGTTALLPATTLNPEQVPAAQEQSFDYFVVIDFEATCDSTLFFPQEIIEFPSVLVAVESLSVADIFQTYVKPTFNPRLTDFCKKLTGIEQSQVDNGVALAEALARHDKWLEEKGVKDKKFGVITWTDWDCKVMLEFECRLKGLTKPSYFNKWINLKSLFQEKFGDKFNLKRAVLHAGLEWQGREHCGLDDARNTAALATEMMRQGVEIKYTQPQASKTKGTGTTNTSNDKLSADFMPRLKKILDALPRSNDNVDVTSTSEASDNLCYCGVKCKTRLVRKAGPNQGKYFLSCGNWTLTEGGKCTYFEWTTAVELKNPEQQSSTPSS